MESGKYIKIGPVAESIPFDDSECTLGADTVQEAIEKLCDEVIVPCICGPLMSATFSVIPGCDDVLYKNIGILTDMKLNTLGLTKC